MYSAFVPLGFSVCRFLCLCPMCNSHFHSLWLVLCVCVWGVCRADVCSPHLCSILHNAHTLVFTHAHVRVAETQTVAAEVLGAYHALDTPSVLTVVHHLCADADPIGAACTKTAYDRHDMRSGEAIPPAPPLGVQLMVFAKVRSSVPHLINYLLLILFPCSKSMSLECSV